MDAALRPEYGAHTRAYASLREDQFDRISHRSRWRQHPAWHGSGEMANKHSRGRANQVNARRDADADGVDEGVLDEFFADCGLKSPL